QIIGVFGQLCSSLIYNDIFGPLSFSSLFIIDTVYVLASHLIGSHNILREIAFLEYAEQFAGFFVIDFGSFYQSFGIEITYTSCNYCKNNKNAGKPTEIDKTCFFT